MLNRKYRYLIALFRERHFGRAAAACNVSPSTLSAAITDLEAEFGYAIVERGKQFSGFTQEGALLIEYALRICDSINSLQQELSQRRGKLTGHLKIGVIPTALTAIAFLSKRFHTKYPDVSMEILSLSTGEIIDQLTKFEIDAGVVYQDDKLTRSYNLRNLWQEPHVLITPDSAMFENRASATWLEASQLNLCLLTPDMKNRQIIDSIFREVGCDINPPVTTNSIVSLLAHISTGTWSGILPRSVIEMMGIPKGTMMLPLTQPTKIWEIALATVKRDLDSPLLMALMDEADELHLLFEKNDQSFGNIHFS